MDYPKSLPDVYLHEGKFTDGTSDGAIPPSRDPAAWANAVTDSILAVQVAGGVGAEEGNTNQLRDAIQAMVLSSAFNINNLSDHAGAAPDSAELAMLTGGIHKRITVAELLTGRNSLDQVARDMAMVTAFQQMISGSVAAGVFADWARVNTFPSDNLPTKTGATHDAVNKTYSNTPGYTADLCAGGLALSGGDTGGYPAANAFDNNDATCWFSAQQGAAILNTAYIGYRFGAPQEVRRVEIKNGDGANDGDDMPVSADVQRWTGAAWVTVASLTLATTYPEPWQTFDLPASGASTDWRVIATDGISTGYGWGVIGLRMRGLTAPANMVLIDTPWVVPTAPQDGRMLVLHKFAGGGVLNTDIKAFMARNGSVAGDWVQGTLSVQDAWLYGSSYNVLVADFDLSSLPNGTQPAVKIQTYNAVEQHIRALGAIAS